jgi:TRAP-type C4-dicarboxylate transport system permease small subunit
MKKVTAFISSSVALAALAPATVYAKNICPSGQFSNLCNLQPDKAGNIVGAVVQILLIIAIILSLFYLIWGGVRYIMSGGDKGKADQARHTLTAAIVGLVISLLAFFFVSMILQFFTGQGLSTLSIPTLY